MATKIALGWDVLMARDGYTRAGRLVAIDDGDWASNVNNGYNSYQAEHDILLDDIVYWLTGKRSAAQVLICMQFTTGIFGSQFTDGLTRLGHSFTQTFTASTLAGYDMADFDMTAMLNLSGDDYDLIDPYLDANGSILTALVGNGNSGWTRYGFETSPGTSQSLTGLSYPYYNRPMTCPPLGRSPYTKWIYTTPTYVTSTKTRPGTTTLYQNDLGEEMAALWENAA